MIVRRPTAARTGRPAGVLSRALAGVAAMLLSTLLASCGGGTKQVQTFQPARLIVFGDDTSAMTATGVKYGVNGLGSGNKIDCTQAPLWVQSLANTYGLVFAACNPTAATPTAFMWATAGARVADVQAQVTEQIAAGGFRSGDLATVLAGENDILDLYAQFPGRSLDDLSAEAGARGAQLAAVVNQLVALGVKVIVSDVPDLGMTPYAIAQKALDPSVDRAAVLSQLTTAFNQYLGVNVVLDGRFVGLVQSQLRFQAIQRVPAAFGFSDITDALCTVPVPNCTTATLVSGGTPGGYLWADDHRLSPGAQAQIASLAIARVQGNPF